jgi:hypothetical protein
MPAHLDKAPIELPILTFGFADKHRINGRLHVVVDAPLAGTLEEGKALSWA